MANLNAAPSWMFFCGKKSINAENQRRFEDYIFGPNYNPERDIEVNDKLTISVLVNNEGEKVRENPNFYQFLLGNRLGSGAHGYVHRIYDYKKKVAIAIKITSKNQEEIISNNLLQSNCKVLKMRLIFETQLQDHFQTNFIYFMELAEGDLKYFFSRYKKALNDNPLIFLNLMAIYLFL